MPLCGIHDRWKHTNTIRSRRATNGRIYLIRPDGSVVKPVGETDPEWAEPPPDEVSLRDPWAEFGRPMSAAELASCRIEPDAGWVVRILDADSIRKR